MILIVVAAEFVMCLFSAISQDVLNKFHALYAKQFGYTTKAEKAKKDAERKKRQEEEAKKRAEQDKEREKRRAEEEAARKVKF